MLCLSRLGRLASALLYERRLAFAVALALPLTGGALCFADEPVVLAQEQIPTQPTAIPDPGPTGKATVLSLNLQQAIDLAMKKQPALEAHRASLASAHTAYQALEALRIPTFIRRDLPVRRQQAHLGISIAEAGLEQANWDTIYAVERTYFAAVYARAQLDVVSNLVKELSTTEKDGRKRSGTKDDELAYVTVNTRLAEIRQIQAAESVNRALAALKEAIGLDPNCCLHVSLAYLPAPRWQICCDDIVSWALTRRGEIAQSGILAEITHLEVEAQGTSFRTQKETFAAAADVHSRQVPQGMANHEYQPGGIPPEMPTLLAGCRPYRIERAKSLGSRAAAVADKTRGLIVLEAEDAYLKWIEASRKVGPATEATKNADRLLGLTKAAYDDERALLKDVTEKHVLAAQARAQYNEVLYHQLLALIALERVTAWGFHAGLANLETPPVVIAADPAKENRDAK